MIELGKQGFRNEFLIANKASSQIQIGDRLYLVHDTGDDEVLSPETGYGPNVGVHVDVIAFDDPEVAKSMDAAFIQIEPGKSTPIQHWIGPRIFIESIISGSGTWIGVSPEGEIVQVNFDSEDDEPGLIAYGEGWIGSWIAGKDGLEIVEICVPPYEEDGTVLVAEAGDNIISETAIPLTFQALYQTLMNIPEI